MIPKTTLDDLLAAMAMFDDQQRHSTEWDGWEQQALYKYAIHHNDRLYPVKEIVAQATGAAKTTFSGGDEANHYVAGYGLEIVLLHAPKMPALTPRVWWVNQGRTYADGLKQGCIWAPKTGQGGRRLSHWDRVGQVRQGDIIVHYSGSVRALGRAVSDATDDQRPYAGGDPQWSEDGRLVKVDYVPLPMPIPLSAIGQKLVALDIKDGPITSATAAGFSVKQGYLWRFTPAGLQVLRDATPAPWPAWAKALLPPPPIDDVTPPGPNGTLGSLMATLGERLHLSTEVVSTYLLALQTKRFVILTGISGTGKTQLALAVAQAFQPTTVVRRPITVPDEAQEREVFPYMLKHNRMIVPAALMATLALPLSDDAHSTGHVTVHYEGHSASLAFYKHQGTAAVQLLFSGPFRKWFEEQLAVGDRFLVQVEPSADDSPPSLRFSLPPTEERTEPIPNYAVIAVRPDWTDGRELLGYYNPLTGQYVMKGLLQLLLDARHAYDDAIQQQRDPIPFFLILDEMNLAHVEHYFSDFLSCLESGEAIELHREGLLTIGDEEVVALPQQLAIPPNLFITGTVNVDETTYMFSPKVLDRAFTLEFNHVDLTGYGVLTNAPTAAPTILELHAFPGHLAAYQRPSVVEWKAFGQVLNGALRQVLLDLHALLEWDHRHFGYRVANEIARFVMLAAVQAAPTEANLWAALDIAILAKVLPKFHGTQQELEEPLARLFAFAVSGAVPTAVAELAAIEAIWHVRNNLLVTKTVTAEIAVMAPRFPRTAAKLWRMLRRLRQVGFASFIE